LDDSPTSLLAASSHPRLLGVPDACRALGVGRSTLFAMLRAGRLPARKLGRRTLVEVAAIDALVAGLPAATFRAPVPPRRPVR